MGSATPQLSLDGFSPSPQLSLGWIQPVLHGHLNSRTTPSHLLLRWSNSLSLQSTRASPASCLTPLPPATH